MKIKTNQQQGAVSKFMLMMIIGAIGYGLYYAKDKGLITKNSISSVSSKVSHYRSKISSRFSSNSDFIGYGVQVMATTQRDQATSVMADFADDGYSAFVIASKNKGRTFYKVRLGPYEYKPEAQAIKDKVKRRYPGSPYLKTSFTKHLKKK